jgi:ATP-dependent Lon protease
MDFVLHVCLALAQNVNANELSIIEIRITVRRGGHMPASYVVASISLDELATELLPARIVIAIDEVDIEYSLWKRRRTMNASPQYAALPATSSANERTLPVIVFGEIVIMPRIQLQHIWGVRPGGSYNAIHAALESNREVLVIFVAEREITDYRSGEPQHLPTVGVIARLEEVVAQPDGTLRIVLDVTTRAIVTARLQHDPFYQATCVPYPDPEVAGAEIQALMTAVKAQVEVIAPTLPNLTPEQVEWGLAFMRQVDQPGQLADFVNYSPTFTFADKIACLNILDPVERLRTVQRILGA